MNRGPLIILLGAAALAYYFYKRIPPLSSPPPGVGAQYQNPPAGGASPPVQQASQLQSIYSRISAAPGVTSTILYNPDQWDFVFNEYAGGGLVAPDPLSIWPSYDRNNPMQLSLSQWWGPMSDYLRSSMGLSGYLHQVGWV